MGGARVSIYGARLLILGTLDAEALRAEAAQIGPHAPTALVHGNDRRDLHHAARAAPPASIRIDARARRIQADRATGKPWECPSFHARIVARVERTLARMGRVTRVHKETARGTLTRATRNRAMERSAIVIGAPPRDPSTKRAHDTPHAYGTVRKSTEVRWEVRNERYDAPALVALQRGFSERAARGSRFPS